MVTFLVSAGAIDAPELVGKIVAPTSVTNGDPFTAPEAMALSFIWLELGRGSRPLAIYSCVG